MNAVTRTTLAATLAALLVSCDAASDARADKDGRFVTIADAILSADPNSDESVTPEIFRDALQALIPATVGASSATESTKAGRALRAKLNKLAREVNKSVPKRANAATIAAGVNRAMQRIADKIASDAADNVAPPAHLIGLSPTDLDIANYAAAQRDAATAACEADTRAFVSLSIAKSVVSFTTYSAHARLLKLRVKAEAAAVAAAPADFTARALELTAASLDTAQADRDAAQTALQKMTDALAAQGIDPAALLLGTIAVKPAKRKTA